MNLEERRIKDKKWYKENREKINKRRMKWGSEHKEKTRIMRKAHYKKFWLKLKIQRWEREKGVLK